MDNHTINFNHSARWYNHIALRSAHEEARPGELAKIYGSCDYAITKLITRIFDIALTFFSSDYNKLKSSYKAYFAETIGPKHIQKVDPQVAIDKIKLEDKPGAGPITKPSVGEVVTAPAQQPASEIPKLAPNFPPSSPTIITPSNTPLKPIVIPAIIPSAENKPQQIPHDPKKEAIPKDGPNPQHITAPSMPNVEAITIRPTVNVEGPSAIPQPPVKDPKSDSAAFVIDKPTSTPSLSPEPTKPKADNRPPLSPNKPEKKNWMRPVAFLALLFSGGGFMALNNETTADSLVPQVDYRVPQVNPLTDPTYDRKTDLLATELTDVCYQVGVNRFGANNVSKELVEGSYRAASDEISCTMWIDPQTQKDWLTKYETPWVLDKDSLFCNSTQEASEKENTYSRNRTNYKDAFFSLQKISEQFHRFIKEKFTKSKLEETIDSILGRGNTVHLKTKVYPAEPKDVEKYFSPKNTS